MRVFRIISARELTGLYKGNYKPQAVNKGENTHVYNNGVDYTHFFRYSYDAEMYMKTSNFSLNQLDRYVIYMIINIPNDILEKYQGYGVYRYDVKDSDIRNLYIPLVEYAIPNELIKPEYVVELNSFIPYEYKSNEKEYKEYINLIKKLIDADIEPDIYLKDKKISDVLCIKDDPRNEEQIKDDHIKEIVKVFSKIKF